MDYSEFKRAFKSENFVENLEEFCDVKYLRNLGNFNDFFANAVYFDLCQNSKDLLKVLLISKDENEFLKFCKILGIRSEFGLKILKNERISFENKIQIKILYISPENESGSPSLHRFRWIPLNNCQSSVC